MEKNLLQRLESIYKSEGLDCALMEETEETPQRILVYLGLDIQKRERVIEVIAESPDITKELQSEGPLSGAAVIQFRSDFPFLAKDDTLFEVRSLTSFLNQLLEIPGFEVDELENRIYYRYVFMGVDSEENLKLTVSVIGTILLLLDVYGAMIEPLAEGKVSFDEMLEEFLEKSEAISETLEATT
ncbi:MAG: hypothetical protein K940chlam7_00469 [Chlamydiae bacterium]|nr:hypothetical protein [Chlamydiota bacterium]